MSPIFGGIYIISANIVCKWFRISNLQIQTLIHPCMLILSIALLWMQVGRGRGGQKEGGMYVALDRHFSQFCPGLGWSNQRVHSAR